MRVIPVIDLLGGSVVRGVAGNRSAYGPIQSQIAADAQPATVARTLVQNFGFRTVYVADLDAIQNAGDNPPFETECYRQIAACGLALWLDAGIGTAATAQKLLAALAPLQISVQLVIGLESLAAPLALAEILNVLGNQAAIFSLDLKGGVLQTKIAAWVDADPVEIAFHAAAHGVSRLIVLDLADVGMSGGTRTLDTCRRIRRALGTAVELTAGGGVRGLDDLLALQDAGCDAALVASALHDGRLTRADLERLACRG